MILWHNPRCSKSRQALALLEEKGVRFEIRKYLEDTPSVTELEALQKALNLPAIDMMRPKEAAFKEMGLSKDMEDSALLAAMAEQPKLIERPVLVNGDKAMTGRPPERILDIL
jgi:arsenate reductase